jgi:putative methylase
LRLRDLERILSKVPPHPKPKLHLEQYATPADLAAPLLHEALALGDITGRRVADLGCGTGVLAIGASLLGAAETVGVDVDPEALAVARRAAQGLGAGVAWVEADVAAWRGAADTIVMNPPFGAQQRGADRVFLNAAFRAAPVVYTLHNAATRAFVESYAEAAGFHPTHAWALRFALRHQYRHHEKAVHEVDVVALRLSRKPVMPSTENQSLLTGVQPVDERFGSLSP